MLVVLDTNVLASGFLHSNPTSATVLLIDLWSADVFSVAISQQILTELSRTFALPYFRQRMSEQDVADAQRLLQDEAQLTPLTVQVSGVATHPEDDLVLATALSAGAKYLVTGDTKLQALRSFEDVQILTPREFHAMLQELPQP